MPTRRKLTVLRLRQKLREVRVQPRQKLVRFVARLKDMLVLVFVSSSSSSCAQAADDAESIRSRITPPRHTPPGYQSIRCVTPFEFEQGLHDHPPPGVPYQQYFPFRSYEDLRAVQEHAAREELREARRRPSSAFTPQSLMPVAY
ncbi:uncharacterized protein K452DRAFT_294256 [Aplosporella prunicola CBS 121167]|uniref:Uncharacterized protein n=1 Tax=Aplosporella prunicola CBS 121167 TaxID=1176127 RepID=A0A6A6BV59_9PEZI|nr:uncharacterized protein K452DRAFT_294256 [Aplosporella prunicola CBS 121167]KAF2146707.1 hypothetical protein K452DRAFT_294256 [Aplosporella prunicola CBS 121167]